MQDETARLTQGLSRCDERAWRDFHDRYYRRLHMLARARGVAECDAPEIVQGVYLRVLRHAKVIRDAEDFGAWLACLVRCEVIDHSRRNGRRCWLNERFQQWQESRRSAIAPDPDERVEEALLALDENERAWIRRHYLEGWSQRQLAAHHRISVKAVESKLARLRKRLRQTIDKPATDPT